MASAEQNVPIFLLPDELLMEIFSYITFIPEKMKLEQVSKRIQSVSSDPHSWKGIHKLELMIKCFRDDWIFMGLQLLEMKGNCNSSNITLNGICVPFAHWPAAIKLLLQRTHINQLFIHCGNDIDLLKANPTVIPNVNQLFLKYDTKMNCGFVELHFGRPSRSKSTDSEAQSVEQSIFTIFTTSLQLSKLHLTEFVLNVDVDGMAQEKGTILRKSIPEIWPIIKECKSLKSFTYYYCIGSNSSMVDDILPVDLKVLIGKPLQKVELFTHLNHIGENTTDDLIQIINEATGSGVETLSVFQFRNNPKGFKFFCDGLNENAKEKLKYINTARFLPFQPHMKYEHLIPSIFPNIVKVQMGKAWIFCSGHMQEFFPMLVSFLNVAHVESSSGCEMEIHVLELSEVKEEFKRNLVNACRNADINVRFGEFPFEVLLSKGNSAIKIGHVIYAVEDE